MLLFRGDTPRNSNVARLPWRALSVAEEYIDDQQGGADGDGGVGDVEGRIVKGAEPNFEEIRDGPVEDTIGDVTGGASK